MFFLLPIICLADLEDDLTKVLYLNDIVTSLIQSTQNYNLGFIQEQLKILEKEVDRAERTITHLESTVSNLAENHANFNSTEAAIVQSLAKSLEEYINVLDEKVRSVDFTTVKNNIPKAIVGQATRDFQAYHSVEKIKQESLKLESTIGSNSKFVWIWGIVMGLVTLALYVAWIIHRAAKANL